jgi:hypothetical protein
MAGHVPAIPIGRHRAFSDRDHRHEAGDGVEGVTRSSNASAVNDTETSNKLVIVR